MAYGRAKGTGCLVKRGKYWTARWTVEGKVYTKSTGCTTKDEALKKLDEYTTPYRIKNEIERLECVKTKISIQEANLREHRKLAAKIQIEELFEEYSRLGYMNDVADETIRFYKWAINAFVKWNKTHKHLEWLHEVKAEDADEFIAFYKKNKTATTSNSVVGILGMIWSNLKLDEKIWTHIKRVASVSKKRAFTNEELIKMFNWMESPAAKRITNIKELTQFFKVALYTGLRLYDCCHLKYSDIDFKDWTFHVLPHKTKKTGRVVIIPIHQHIKEMIQAMHTENSDDDVFMFPNIKHQFDHHTIHRTIRVVLQNSGMTMNHKNDNGSYQSVLSFHSFRHTFVSMCANNNMPQKMVQSLVGHASDKMTSRYYHNDLNIARQHIETLPDLSDRGKVIERFSIELEKDVYQLLLDKSLGDINSYLRDVLTKKYVLVSDDFVDTTLVD